MSGATRRPGRPAAGASLLGISQRTPPVNFEAEQALLGAILANNKAYRAVQDFLAPEHFADPVHAAIYAAAAKRIDGGGVADAVTLAAHFANSGQLDDAGGNQYLAQLLSAMVGIINAGEYARVIVDAWTRRELIAAGEALVNAAFDRTSDLPMAVHEAARALDGTAGVPGQGVASVSMDVALDAALAAAEAAAAGGGPSGLLTGFASLDRVWNGLDDGTLNVLAARPRVGKTALGMQIAINVARDVRSEQAPGAVYVQSLEMNAIQIAQRALAAASRVPGEKIRRGEIEFSRSQLRQARRDLAGLPLHIDETSSLNIKQIAQRAREMKRRHGRLALVVVDHLHIVAFDRDYVRGGFGATQATGEISRGLKELAKNLSCPVLALAQLSRGVDTRDDKRPILADLRQSGDIEQDADSVVFLYRPELYVGAEPEQLPGENMEKWRKRVMDWEEQRDRVRGKAEAIFAKVRGGSEQTVRLRWDGETTTFEEPAPRAVPGW